jgi:hypothetical protein
MNPSIKRSWDDFLNPEIMRPRLISASIYIAVFEALKEAIVSRVQDLFFMGSDESGDKTAPEYQSNVLARNKSPVYASLDWLKEMDAIGDADVLVFDRVKARRNMLAHNLLSILIDEGLPDDFAQCFTEMVELFRKIEVWWIMNFEIPINPDFDGSDLDEEEILPGLIMIIQLLLDIGLGDEGQSRSYYNKFRKQSRDG